MQLLIRPSIQFVQQTKAARHNDFVTPDNHLQETSENLRSSLPKFRDGSQQATTLGMQRTSIRCSMQSLWHDSLGHFFKVFQPARPTWNFVQSVSFNQPVQLYRHVLSGPVSSMQIAGRSSTTKSSSFVCQMLMSGSFPNLPSFNVVRTLALKICCKHGKKYLERSLVGWPYYQIQRYPKASIYLCALCHSQKTLRLLSPLSSFGCAYGSNIYRAVISHRRWIPASQWQGMLVVLVPRAWAPEVDDIANCIWINADSEESSSFGSTDDVKA